MGTVSFTGAKTCLVCGLPLPAGWRDDVHRDCALSDGGAPTQTVPRISNLGPKGRDRFTTEDVRAILADLKTDRPTADIAAQYGVDEETILRAGKELGGLPKGKNTSGSQCSEAPNGLYDDIERLVREGKTKNAIAQELHTSWETITKVCKERNLTPVRGHRGKSITIKTRSKPEPAQPTASDKVQMIRDKRMSGVGIDELAIEFGVLPSTVELICDGVKPAAVDAPDDPVTAPTPIEKENAVPDTTCELDAARELVSAREKAYQAKFGELAVAALTGETPDLGLVRLAYEYGFAVGGYRVLAAMVDESGGIRCQAKS